ncbi:MAG: FAD/NAD(P)-binding protein [Syntrophomonadaceae bacterium]
MQNIYLPEVATIHEIKQETPKIRTLIIDLEKTQPMRILPGQFIELTVFGFGEFPVSVSGVLNPEGTRIQTTIQQVGKVTEETAKLSPGSKVGVRGPFGNGYPLEAMRGKNICLITGGVGLAAARSLINHILKNRDLFNKVQLLHGAKTPSDLIYREFLFNNEEAHKYRIDINVTVDRPNDRWSWRSGPVTELFNTAVVHADNTIAVICGPGKMIKNVSQHLIEMGFSDDQVLLALESRMHCGIGMCGHCAVGYKKVCVDGPIFEYGEVKNNLENLLQV